MLFKPNKFPKILKLITNFDNEKHESCLPRVNLKTISTNPQIDNKFSSSEKVVEDFIVY